MSFQHGPSSGGWRRSPGCTSTCSSAVTRACRGARSHWRWGGAADGQCTACPWSGRRECSPGSPRGGRLDGRTPHSPRPGNGGGDAARRAPALRGPELGSRSSGPVFSVLAPGKPGGQKLLRRWKGAGKIANPLGLSQSLGCLRAPRAVSAVAHGVLQAGLGGSRGTRFARAPPRFPIWWAACSSARPRSDRTRQALIWSLSSASGWQTSGSRAAAIRPLTATGGG